MSLPVSTASLTLRHRYIPVNGITLHIVECGPEDGPLLLMLHGFPEFWYEWKDYMEPLAALGYWVVAPDQRGYNLSDKPEGVDAYQIDTLATDMAELILALGAKNVKVVAHDWGGGVAWRMLDLFPELIHRCMIINCPHARALRKLWKTSLDQRMKSWYMLFFQLAKVPEWVLRRNDYAYLRHALQKSPAYSEADMAVYVASWKNAGSLSSMLNWYRAMARTMAKRGQGGRIAVPVKIIWGTGDHALSANLAPLSLKECEHGELQEIPGASHWVPKECFDVVFQAIVEFFSRVEN